MRPDHYSHDIAERCEWLIKNVGPRIKERIPGDERFGGPVYTTFLLAMATPMIVLPIERIFKPANRDGAIADDRELDPELARHVANVFSPGKSFGETAFATGTQWSYVSDYPRFNIANAWPEELLDRLRSDDAVQEAQRTEAKRIFLDLRNALAHGGVTYLDEHGGLTEGPAGMLAFTAKTHPQSPNINALRIATGDFRDLLEAWLKWLVRSQVSGLLNRESGLAA